MLLTYVCCLLSHLQTLKEIMKSFHKLVKSSVIPVLKVVRVRIY